MLKFSRDVGPSRAKSKADPSRRICVRGKSTSASKNDGGEMHTWRESPGPERNRAGIVVCRFGKKGFRMRQRRALYSRDRRDAIHQGSSLRKIQLLNSHRAICRRGGDFCRPPKKPDVADDNENPETRTASMFFA